MHQISDESIDVDRKNIAENLVQVIVGDAMNTIYDQKERSVDSPKLQNLGNEETIVCNKSEGMNLEKINFDKSDQLNINNFSYHNLSEVCVHSSTLAPQGEGDFQNPYVREAKAFHNLESEGVSGGNQTCLDSPHSSVHSSFTDELIAQLHNDINNLSLDNINLSDSEVEKELKPVENGYERELPFQEGNEKMQANQCCQTNCYEYLDDNLNYCGPYHGLRHSPKFSQLNNVFSNQYIRLNENYDERGTEEEQRLLSTSSEECLCSKSKAEGCMDSFTQTNSLDNPFIWPNGHFETESSTFYDEGVPVNESIAVKEEENRGDDDWVEANEVQISITEPGCSKDTIAAENIMDDTDAVKVRQYWSNVGLVTEHEVDRRYLGPVESPGVEFVKGVSRVESKYLTGKPEEVIWATEARELEVGSINSIQEAPNDEDENYLSFPKATEEIKKKKNLISRLTKTISSIFKINNK